MTLLLDVGHTRAKFGEERDGQVSRLGVFSIDEMEPLYAALRERRGQGEVLHAASTLQGGAGAAMQKGVEEAWGQAVAWIDPESARGDIGLHYAKPETFGVDRLLAMRAARQRTRSACIVVDAGSAVTVDGLTEDNRHCGGWIVPGYSRQKGALEMLPEFEVVPPVAPESTVNTGTAEAVESGVWRLLSGGIDAICARLREEVLGESTEVFITGGDAEQLQIWCRTKMVIVSDLVLEGLAARLR